MPTTSSPTLTPRPTDSPTKSPLQMVKVTTQVNLMITLRNTLNRNMTVEEELDFDRKLLTFLSEGLTLESDGVSVDKMDVWYQQQVDWDGRRRVQEQFTTSSAITLILQVSHYYTLDKEAGSKIVEFVEKAEVAIINLFRGDEGSMIFYMIDALKATVVDEVTLAPTPMPLLPVQQKAAVSANGMSGGGMCMLILAFFSYFLQCRLFSNILHP